MQEYLKYEKPIKEIASFYYKPNGIFGTEDLYNLGLQIAHQCITNFDSKKKMKESSYVLGMVKRRMIDYIRKITDYSRARKTGRDEVSIEGEEIDLDKLECLSIDPELFNGEKDEYDKIKVIIKDKLLQSEQEVISMYFFENKNLRQIGEIKGVTESRVNQIKQSALNKIKRSLTLN